MWQTRNGQKAPDVLTTLGMGAISSFCGQTMAYPFQLVRTRLQSQGIKSQGYQYKSMLDCFVKVKSEKGYLGLYKGMGPNLMKTIPAISISYVVYEQMKLLLKMDI